MNAKLVALWICFSYASDIPRLFNASNKERIEVSIGNMTRHIVERYFSHAHCVGIIVQDDNLLRHILTAAPTVVAVVSTVPKMADDEEFEIFQEETKIFDNIIVEQLNQGCLSFIIQVNAPELLVEYFYRSSRRSKSRSNKRYLFLPPLGSHETLSYNATRIFRMKEMEVMPEVAVAKLVRKDETFHETCSNRNIALESDGMDQRQHMKDIPHNCTTDTRSYRKNRQQRDGITTSNYSCPKWDEIEIVTHRFVGSNPDTELWLDTWISGKGFLQGANLYPDKMRNLQGKMVNVAAVPNYPPYTIIYTNSTPPVYDGIELRFVKDFAQQLNFTFRVVTDEVGWWGEIWPNGTGNGMWGYVAMDVAIMGFGATYAWLENYPHLDFSLPYFRSSVRCLTPRPQKLPNWMTPLLPFSRSLWIAVGIAMLSTTTSLYLVARSIISLHGFSRHVRQRFSTVTASALSSLGLLVLQAPDEERSPQYVPLRHLLAWFMVFFLLISSVYSGGLASVLTVPRFEHPINSVEDLAKSDILWAGTTAAWAFSILEATEPNMAHITRNFRVIKEEQLRVHAFVGDLAFAVERLLGGNYALPSFVNEETAVNLRAMRDDLYSGYCVFNVRKASPFLESLNALILKLHAAGLLLNYEGQVVRALSQRMQLVLAQNDQPTSDSSPVTLQIQHVQGPLFLLGFGLLAALLVFIMEIIKSCLPSRNLYIPQ